MRRPVDVNAHFRFLLFVSVFRFSQAASVAILPSALFCERYSLGASWVFSFQWCCYLIIDLISQRFGESWAPGLSRSHLDSAVELGSSYSILRHGAYPFTVLFFFISLSPFHCALSASIVGIVSHPGGGRPSHPICEPGRSQWVDATLARSRSPV